MASRPETQALIKSAFPDRDPLIDRAYRENRSFRDLCRDYRRCAAALARWRRSDGVASSDRADEYADLLTELTREIEAWFDTMGTIGSEREASVPEDP